MGDGWRGVGLQSHDGGVSDGEGWGFQWLMGREGWSFKWLMGGEGGASSG